MNEVLSQFEEQYGDLTQDLKQYITSTEVVDGLLQVIDTWNIDDVNDFTLNVIKLTIGELKVEMFTEFVASKYGLTEEESDLLLEDLYVLILKDAWQLQADQPENKNESNVEDNYILETQQPEQVHTLDLEIPPLNLPMVESQEEHDRLVAQYNLEQQAKPVTSKNYNERVQSAASALASMLQSRGVEQSQTSDQTPPQEIQQISITPQAPETPQPHFPANPAPKFSYHDKDPYREPPEP